MLTILLYLGAGLALWCVLAVLAAAAPFVLPSALYSGSSWVSRWFNRYCDTGLGYLSLAIPWLVMVAPLGVAFALSGALAKARAE